MKNFTDVIEGIIDVIEGEAQATVYQPMGDSPRLAIVGEQIKAYDFEPLEGRRDSFVEGVVTAIGPVTELGFYAYTITVTRDVRVGTDIRNRVNEQLFVPLGTDMDYDGRVKIWVRPGKYKNAMVGNDAIDAFIPSTMTFNLNDHEVVERYEDDTTVCWLTTKDGVEYHTVLDLLTGEVESDTLDNWME